MENDYNRFKSDVNNFVDSIKREFNNNFDNLTKIRVLINKNKGYITTKEINKNKIGRDYLKKLVTMGEIEKVSRGIYIDKNILEDCFYTFYLRHPNAVFSHFTALYFYDMTEVIPNVFDITCANNFYSNDFNKYNVFYVKDSLLDLGCIMVDDKHGFKVKCYDLERTICDIIRSKNRLDYEQIKKSVRLYVKRKDKDIKKLIEYAEKLGIKNEVVEFVGMYYE